MFKYRVTYEVHGGVGEVLTRREVVSARNIRDAVNLIDVLPALRRILSVELLEG